MSETDTPSDGSQSGFQKFKRSKFAIPVGLIVALAFAIVLFYAGVFVGLCGFGFLLIAVLLFAIPKVFGAKDLKVMVAFGVVSFLVISMVGAFAVSLPAIHDNGTDGFDSNGYDNLGFSTVDGTTTVTVDHDAGKTVTVNFSQVNYICYGIYKYSDNKVNMTESSSGVYSADIPTSNGKIYAITFSDGSNSSKTVFYTGLASDSDQTTFALAYNCYYVGLVTIMFFLILFTAYWMNKNLEKTRAQMEAEGRLYPKGYGRCKKCGGIILPGEDKCRKCGTPIDVPAEMRHKRPGETIVCSECGAEVPIDAKKCPKCGASFDDDIETVEVDDDKKKNE